MEVIDLGLSDLDQVSISFKDEPYSNRNSLGDGIELLMNDKKKSSTGSMNIDLGELDKLEDELNDLSKSADTKSIGGLGGGFGSFFGFGKDKQANANANANNNADASSSNIGQATADSMGNTKTWDGFTKLNDVQPTESYSSSSKMSDREKRRKKRMMIKKINEWYEKGIIKNNSHYTIDSNYEEVEDEYETTLEEKRKKDSIKLQGWWFMTAVNSIEYANSAFNPFDINLDGWGEQVNEDIDSYEEIFAELHDKYKGGKLSPEISLLLRLGFSAAVVNFTNKALSSATPAFNDVIKQSPELMKMFTNATVSSMSQASPGFNFANNMMKDATGPSMNMGPPPAPVETKTMPFSGQRPGNNTMTSNRPDISMGRGAAPSSGGIDINQPYEQVNNSRPMNMQQPPQNQFRNEMKGPQRDIDSILSGLKTRTVDIHPPQNPQNSQNQMNTNANTNIQDSESVGFDDSMISISSLKDMQDANMPKRTRRRNNLSRGNTISLDI
jgi:hypothetical protein